MTELWTVRKVLGWTHQHFERKGLDSPRLTAEVLLAHALTVDRIRLYVDLDRPLEPPELARFRGLVERRSAGEPTQYLTGQREFYNRPFLVDPRVLIPRPETELLVDAVLELLPKDSERAVLDVCTGSGCIAITLAAERPLTQVRATDLSPEACAVARHNAEHLGVAARCRIDEGDLFAPLPAGSVFDVVVSNPPYVTRGEISGLSKEVQREPKLALDGGADGLEVLRRVITGAIELLRSEGVLALEIGETQGDAVRGLLLASGYRDVRVERDLEKRDRMAFGVK